MGDNPPIVKAPPDILRQIINWLEYEHIARLIASGSWLFMKTLLECHTINHLIVTKRPTEQWLSPPVVIERIVGLKTLEIEARHLRTWPRTIDPSRLFANLQTLRLFGARMTHLSAICNAPCLTTFEFVHDQSDPSGISALAGICLPKTLHTVALHHVPIAILQCLPANVSDLVLHIERSCSGFDTPLGKALFPPHLVRLKLTLPEVLPAKSLIDALNLLNTLDMESLSIHHADELVGVLTAGVDKKRVQHFYGAYFAGFFVNHLMPRLQHLTVRVLPITLGIVNLLPPGLVTLEGVIQVEAIQEMQTRMQKLERFVIQYDPLWGPGYPKTQTILQHIPPNVTELDTTEMLGVYEGIHLANLPKSITRLDLKDFSLQDGPLPAIPQVTRLQITCRQGSRGLPPTLADLGLPSTLVHLDLLGIDMTCRFLFELDLPQLRRLKIEQWSKIPQEPYESSRVPLPKLTELEIIKFTLGSVQDIDLLFGTLGRQLRLLHIGDTFGVQLSKRIASYCPNVMDASLPILKPSNGINLCGFINCTRLHLMLLSTMISSDIAQLPQQLMYLRLTRTKTYESLFSGDLVAQDFWKPLPKTLQRIDMDQMNLKFVTHKWTRDQVPVALHHAFDKIMS